MFMIMQALNSNNLVIHIICWESRSYTKVDGDTKNIKRKTSRQGNDNRISFRFSAPSGDVFTAVTSQWILKRNFERFLWFDRFTFVEDDIFCTDGRLTHGPVLWTDEIWFFYFHDKVPTVNHFIDIFIRNSLFIFHDFTESFFADFAAVSRVKWSEKEQSA